MSFLPKEKFCSPAFLVKGDTCEPAITQTEKRRQSRLRNWQSLGDHLHPCFQATAGTLSAQVRKVCQSVRVSEGGAKRT